MDKFSSLTIDKIGGMIIEMSIIKCNVVNVFVMCLISSTKIKSKIPNISFDIKPIPK